MRINNYLIGFSIIGNMINKDTIVVFTEMSQAMLEELVLDLNRTI
jgi:hypothetical protein